MSKLHEPEAGEECFLDITVLMKYNVQSSVAVGPNLWSELAPLSQLWYSVRDGWWIPRIEDVKYRLIPSCSESRRWYTVCTQIWPI